MKKFVINVKKLSQYQSFIQIPTIVAIIVFAAAGSFLLFRSKAATPFATLEPEQGDKSNQVIAKVEDTASSKNFVQFGVHLPPPITGHVKVMTLGDSITHGYNVPGGYRIDLWGHLTYHGYDFDFVGSQSNGPDALPDKEHEGYPGWEIDQISQNVAGWLAVHKPQVILLQIGTNDMIRNVDVANAPNRLTNLIDWINYNAPNARLIVASIMPMSDPVYNDRALVYNAAIPGIVNSRDPNKVFYVDMYNAITPADLVDGVHPSREGYNKMALAWYFSLIRLIAR